jgi:hypothetical protein
LNATSLQEWGEAEFVHGFIRYGFGVVAVGLMYPAVEVAQQSESLKGTAFERFLTAVSATWAEANIILLLCIAVSIIAAVVVGVFCFVKIFKIPRYCDFWR